MYRDPYVYYQPQHPQINSNQHPQLDDRFQHSAACGFFDRKECKEAENIWAKIMEKDEEDRADFVKRVDKELEKGSFIPQGWRLIERLRKAQRGVWKEYAVLLEELKDKYHLKTVTDKKWGGKMGIYQWFNEDKKKDMYDYLGWLKQVIHLSIDPNGPYAGERGPVPTMKDIAAAKLK